MFANDFEVRHFVYACLYMYMHYVYEESRFLDAKMALELNSMVPFADAFFLLAPSLSYLKNGAKTETIRMTDDLIVLDEGNAILKSVKYDSSIYKRNLKFFSSLVGEFFGVARCKGSGFGVQDVKIFG